MTDKPTDNSSNSSRDSSNDSSTKHAANKTADIISLDENSLSQNSPDQGFDAKAFLRKAPKSPGVYRMYNEAGDILYVGKAKILKNRLSSYFQKQGLSLKTKALVSRIHHIETTITHSETEALILEQNQIKTLKPPFNILLRDDKSYPYIYLASDKTFPSVGLKRVRSKGKVGQYFGGQALADDYQWLVLFESGPLEGLTYGVQGEIVIGRALECDITVLTNHVSRQHAKLYAVDGALMIEDMGSANGTRVNGTVIAAATSLSHDDEVT